jgi:hypothetical protein
MDRPRALQRLLRRSVRTPQGRFGREIALSIDMKGVRLWDHLTELGRCFMAAPMFGQMGHM